MRKFVLLVILASFAGGLGIGPLCASCAPGKAMDCCQKTESTDARITAPPCCESGLNVLPESAPAVVAKQSAPRADFDFARVVAPITGPRLPEDYSRSSTPPSPDEDAPPLFLLNSSLLR
jgi:hypothetical protein